MNDMVSRYGKEVMIVEIGMPWDQATECQAFIKDIITKTKSVSSSKGLGVLYWEPQAYNNWVGYTLGLLITQENLRWRSTRLQIKCNRFENLRI
jgi:arabinogalactan endo-1,4-beta-galactosidase